MNYIGIDPSKISTGLCVNGKLFNYCRYSDAWNKKSLKKWFALGEDHITYRYITLHKIDNYSDSEIMKVRDFGIIADMIIEDIVSNIDISQPTKVAIEGFSYASDVGDIIDLVAFSTLLRDKLLKHVTQDIIVLAPTSLKKESCMMTYEPIDIGKRKPKLVYKNNEGIAGGLFTKHEMYMSIVENEKLRDGYTKLLRDIKEDVWEVKNIPKPFEDVNDSYLLYLYLVNKYKN